MEGRAGFGTPPWGLTVRIEGVGYPEVVSRTRAALAAEGFGVITEIDVQKTMAEKLGADFQPYVILGACNPPLAHQALSAIPGLGLLLPCNVVVTREPDGGVVISALDPVAIFGLVEDERVAGLAAEVGGRLARVLAALRN